RPPTCALPIAAYNQLSDLNSRASTSCPQKLGCESRDLRSVYRSSSKSLFDDATVWRDADDDVEQVRWPGEIVLPHAADEPQIAPSRRRRACRVGERARCRKAREAQEDPRRPRRGGGERRRRPEIRVSRRSPPEHLVRRRRRLEAAVEDVEIVEL